MNLAKGYAGGFGRTSVTRRRILQRTAFGTLGFAAVTAGCSSSTNNKASTAAPARGAQATTTAAAKLPRRGGTLLHAGGTVGSYDTQGAPFDPHTIASPQAKNYRLIYQGLLGYDAVTYDVKPEIAQKWEQPSQTEYVFTVQPGVKWQNKPPANGRALSTADITYSLERARTNDPRFLGRSLLLAVDTIQAIDNATLKISTKLADATTLVNLSGDQLMVLAPEVVDKAGKFATPDAVVGTGAFMLKSVQERASAEYVRNPDYWKPGRPFLDGIRNLNFEAEQTAFAAFQAGQLNIARVPGTEAKNYIGQQGQNFNAPWYADDTCLMLQPNVRTKPFDDSRVTRAMRLLIDHKEFTSAWAESWFGRGQHGSLFCTALQAWDLTQGEYEQQLEWKPAKDDAVKEAMSLLSAAGYSKDNPLKFEFANQGVPPGTFSDAFAVLVVSQWKRLGQGVVLPDNKPYELATSNSVRSNHTFTYFGGGNAGATVEPDSWLSQLYRTNGSRNYMGFSDPQLDGMIDKQRSIFDVTQRKAAVKDIIKYAFDHVPETIPADRFFLNAITSKVQGYSPEFYMNGQQYENIWLDA